MDTVGDILERLNLTKKASGSHSMSERYSCPICRDAGYVHPLKGDGKPDFSQVAPCLCRAQEKLERFYRLSDIPEEYRHCSFDNFEVFDDLKEAYDAAFALAEEDEAVGLKWLTLLGDTDRGKTHLAVAICQRWIQRGKLARYAYVPALLDELRRGFERDAGLSYQEKFDFFCQVPLLVLDDLGVEKQSPWVDEKLDTIVHLRGANGLPLVITTNLRVGELPKRIASRIQREKFCKVVGIEAKEYQQRGEYGVGNS